MPTITNSRGQVIDLGTGEVVGRTAAAPTVGKPRSAEAGAVSTEASITSVLNQFSSNFNTALFYLPDSVVRKVGTAAGVPEKDIPQFVNLFKGAPVDPKNAPERFAAALGQGVGAAIPFSGITQGLAQAGILKAPLTGEAGALKRVAKDMLDFIRKNPKQAVAIDIAAGAAFEGLRQGVEETAEDGEFLGMDKELAKELIPPVALLGGPAAAAKVAGVLPSVVAARALKGAAEVPVDRQAIYKEIRGKQYPSFLSPLQNFMIKRGEKRIGQMFGNIEGNPQAQAMMAEYRSMLDDPRILQAFEEEFAAKNIQGTPGLDIAQQTLDPALLKTKAEMLNKLSGDLLNSIRQRQLAEQGAFTRARESLAPEAGAELPAALRSVADEAVAEQERLAGELEGMLGTEINRVSETFGRPGDITGIGSSIRNTIMAANEGFFKQFQRYADRLGLRVQFDNTGVPMNARDADGNSLFPTVDVGPQINNIIGRFKLSKKNIVPTQTPRIVNLLARYRAGKQPSEQEILGEFKNIIASQMGENAFMADSYIRDLAPIIQRLSRNKGLTQEEEIFLRTKGLSPDRIKETYDMAVQAAEANVVVDLNLPEAVQLIDEAAKFRNGQIKFAEDAMLTRGMNKQKANDAVKLGEQVYKDVEDMVFKAFPQKMGANWNDFSKLYRDYYSDTYERFFPLVVGKTRGTAAREFSLPDEAVVAEAFKNSDNVRSLVQIMRPDQIAKNKELIQRGLMDWVRSKGAVDANTGLVNVARLRKIKADEAAILKQLPADIRSVLDDEISFGQAYADRVAQVQDRIDTIKNSEVMSLIKKSIREDADPEEFLLKAIRDPANMRVAVNAMQKDPENLAALRRSVFELITGEITAPVAGALKDVIGTHRKALSILFDKQHLDDLDKLGELQVRVFAQKDITGTVPEYASASERFRQAFGITVPGLATYYREVQSGRIGTEGAAITLLVRALSAEDNRLYDRLLDKAITDPDFARAIMDKSKAGKSIASDANLNKKAMGLGIYLPGVARYATVRATTAGIEEQPTEAAELPVVQEPRPTRPLPPAPPSSNSARQMLDKMNAGVPTKGFPFKPVYPTQGPTGSQQGVSLPNMPTYEALFPNDPIVPLLKARKTQPIPQ